MSVFANARTYLRQLDIPQRFLGALFLLNLGFSLSTLFQTSMSLVVWGLPVVFLLACGSPLKSLRDLRDEPALTSPFFWILSVVLCWGACFAAYYASRDNDGVQFWMVKAKALALYGYLPSVPREDPRVTVSHDYPLGGVVLSALIQSLRSSFSVVWHRWAAIAQALLVWIFAFRLFQSRKQWAELLMFLAVGLTPALWSNGYLDTLWTLGFAVAWAFAMRGDLLNAGLLFAFVGGLKSEAAIFVVLAVAVLVFLKRLNARLLLALAPIFVWKLVVGTQHLEASRHMQWPPHSLATILSTVWIETVPLLLFRTFTASTSAILLCALGLFFYLKRIEQLFVVGMIGVFVAAYAVSSFAPDWNVHFSWSRLVWLPAMFCVVNGLLAKQITGDKFRRPL